MKWDAHNSQNLSSIPWARGFSKAGFTGRVRGLGGLGYRPAAWTHPRTLSRINGKALSMGALDFVLALGRDTLCTGLDGQAMLRYSP